MMKNEFSLIFETFFTNYFDLGPSYIHENNK